VVRIERSGITGLSWQKVMLTGSASSLKNAADLRDWLETNPTKRRGFASLGIGASWRGALS